MNVVQERLSRREHADRSGEMTFLQHLQELRKRIVVSMLAWLVATVIAYVAYPWVLKFLMAPFHQINQPMPGNDLLFVNSIFEGFVTRFKISLLVGVILSFPIHLFNLLKFVFPGLEPKEKRVITLSLAVSFFLIFGGGYYGYDKMIPTAVSFFTSTGFIPTKVGLLLNYNKSILYVLQFLMISLATFELPVVLEICMVMGLLKRRVLLRFSRYVVIIIFVFAAIITPPDPVSQLVVAVPLVGLYFLAIGVAWIFRFGE